MTAWPDKQTLAHAPAPLPPERLATDEVAANPFFTVRRDRLAIGAGYDYHYLAARGDAVLVVPMLPDGRFLLERIYRHAVGTWHWEFPAGGIDADEEPLAAAQRELVEETGAVSRQWQAAGVIEPLPGLVRLRVHCFIARAVERQQEACLEAAELLQLVACQRQEIEALLDDPAQPVSAFLSLGYLAWWRSG